MKGEESILKTGKIVIEFITFEEIIFYFVGVIYALN